MAVTQCLASSELVLWTRVILDSSTIWQIMFCYCIYCTESRGWLGATFPSTNVLWSSIPRQCDLLPWLHEHACATRAHCIVVFNPGSHLMEIYLSFNKIQHSYMMQRLYCRGMCTILYRGMVSNVMTAILSSPIARLMGPTWGPSGGDRTQVGPMLAPWTLLSGFQW